MTSSGAAATASPARKGNAMNLVEGILAECNRVRQLVPFYEELGPVGAFGAAMLKAAVAEGEASLGSGDVVRMAAAFKSLQECEA
jgi:hypothetical protein